MEPAKIQVTLTCNNGNTDVGQSVYAVGSTTELGNWTPANALALSADNYPTWSGTVEIPAGTTVEWKCIKKAGEAVVWSEQANSSFTTPQSGTASSTGSF